MNSNQKHTEIIQQIKSIITSDSKKIAIVSHYNPDGDAIGSILGLTHYLTKLGHTVYPISPDEFPGFLHWMPGSKEILIYEKDKKSINEHLKKVDVIWMVDFNDPERLNDFKVCISHSSAKKILIDHHPNPATFAEIILSDVSVSSTAELIYEIIIGISGKKILDRKISECLFAGIMTDTGCFSFNSSRPETYTIVAVLLSTNINKDRIFRNIYETFSYNRMKLLGYSLYDKLCVLPEYFTAYIALTREELKKFHFQIGDTEGFVNHPFAIKDITFSVLFIEKDDHIKVSFRSKGSFSANTFALKHFEGGGHNNAAGGKSYLTMKETIEKFVNLLPQYQTKLRNALTS